MVEYSGISRDVEGKGAVESRGWKYGENLGAGDPWLPDVENPYIVTPEPIYLNKPCVQNLFSPSQKQWDYDLLRDMFCQRDVDLITSVPIQGW